MNSLLANTIEDAQFQVNGLLTYFPSVTKLYYTAGMKSGVSSQSGDRFERHCIEFHLYIIISEQPATGTHCQTPSKYGWLLHQIGCSLGRSTDSMGIDRINSS